MINLFLLQESYNTGLWHGIRDQDILRIISWFLLWDWDQIHTKYLGLGIKSLVKNEIKCKKHTMSRPCTTSEHDACIELHEKNLHSQSYSGATIYINHSISFPISILFRCIAGLDLIHFCFTRSFPQIIKDRQWNWQSDKRISLLATFTDSWIWYIQNHRACFAVLSVSKHVSVSTVNPHTTFQSRSMFKVDDNFWWTYITCTVDVLKIQATTTRIC